MKIIGSIIILFFSIFGQVVAILEAFGGAWWGIEGDGGWTAGKLYIASLIAAFGVGVQIIVGIVSIFKPKISGKFVLILCSIIGLPIFLLGGYASFIFQIFIAFGGFLCYTFGRETDKPSIAKATLLKVSGAFGVVLVATLMVFITNIGGKKEKRKIRKIRSALIEVSADEIDKKNEGKLLFINGNLTNLADLRDKEFDIARKALKLKRALEMYQWYETDKYTYEKAWFEKSINSFKFREKKSHKNPRKKWKSKELSATNLLLGKYEVSKSALKKLKSYEKLELKFNQDQLEKIRLKYSTEDTKVKEGYVYFSENIEEPNIGDYRLSYQEIKNQEVTISARQRKGKLERHRRLRAFYVVSGDKSVDEVLKSSPPGGVINILLKILGYLVFITGIVGVVYFGFYRTEKIPIE